MLGNIASLLNSHVGDVGRGWDEVAGAWFGVWLGDWACWVDHEIWHFQSLRDTQNTVLHIEKTKSSRSSNNTSNRSRGRSSSRHSMGIRVSDQGSGILILE